MKKKEKLFSQNGKNVFEFNFGFNYPYANFNTRGIKDNRYVKKSDIKNKTKK
tara:strand:- start:906 stop:1061 length:156 start_codon:yes stop_codon:yes gene_type:complete